MTIRRLLGEAEDRTPDLPHAKRPRYHCATSPAVYGTGFKYNEHGYTVELCLNSDLSDLSSLAHCAVGQTLRDDDKNRKHHVIE